MSDTSPTAGDADTAAMMVEHPQTEGQRGAIGDCPQLSSSIAIPSLLAASSSKSPSPVGLALFESLTAVPVASFYFFSPPTHREPQSAQCLQHSEKGKKRVQADTSSAKGSPEISETVQSRAVQGESSAAPSVSAPMSADRNKRRRMQQASFGTLTERMEEEACGEASNVESDERNVEVEGEVVTPTEANAAGRDVSDQTDSVCVNGRTPISPTISDISDAVSSIRISADDALAIPEDLCEDGRLDMERAIRDRAEIEAGVDKKDRPCFWAHVLRFASVRPEPGTAYLPLTGRGGTGLRPFMRAMPHKPKEWPDHIYMWDRYKASFIRCCPHLHVLDIKPNDN